MTVRENVQLALLAQRGGTVRAVVASLARAARPKRNGCSSRSASARWARACRRDARLRRSEAPRARNRAGRCTATAADGRADRGPRAARARAPDAAGFRSCTHRRRRTAFHRARYGRRVRARRSHRRAQSRPRDRRGSAYVPCAPIRKCAPYISAAPPVRSAAMLEVRGLEAGYGRATILFDVSFDVGQGEAVALLGRNGAGKSTTLKAIAGWLKPSRGNVRLDGRRIDGAPSYRIARAGLGFVPEGRRIFSGLTVAQISRSAAALRTRARRGRHNACSCCFRPLRVARSPWWRDLGRRAANAWRSHAH